MPTRTHTAPAIPTTMHAAAIDRAGGPELLPLHTLPVPDLDAHEVLIAAEYPLADAARAHERLARGHILGKVVLRVR